MKCTDSIARASCDLRTSGSRCRTWTEDNGEHQPVKKQIRNRAALCDSWTYDAGMCEGREVQDFDRCTDRKHG